MMEYTILSFVALLLSVALALYLKVDRKRLAAVSMISVFFQLIFDNLMTGLGLWSFDLSFTLGLLVPVIPLENLLFGVSLTIAVVCSWEYLNR